MRLEFLCLIFIGSVCAAPSLGPISPEKGDAGRNQTKLNEMGLRSNQKEESSRNAAEGTTTTKRPKNTGNTKQPKTGNSNSRTTQTNGNAGQTGQQLPSGQTIPPAQQIPVEQPSGQTIPPAQQFPAGASSSTREQRSGVVINSAKNIFTAKANPDGPTTAGVIGGLGVFFMVGCVALFIQDNRVVPVPQSSMENPWVNPYQQRYSDGSLN
jgi:hypothetical protein